MTNKNNYDQTKGTIEQTCFFFSEIWIRKPKKCRRCWFPECLNSSRSVTLHLKKVAKPKAKPNRTIHFGGEIPIIQCRSSWKNEAKLGQKVFRKYHLKPWHVTETAVFVTQRPRKKRKKKKKTCFAPHSTNDFDLRNLRQCNQQSSHPQVWLGHLEFGPLWKIRAGPSNNTKVIAIVYPDITALTGAQAGKHNGWLQKVATQKYNLNLSSLSSNRWGLIFMWFFSYQRWLLHPDLHLASGLKRTT